MKENKSEEEIISISVINGQWKHAVAQFLKSNIEIKDLKCFGMLDSDDLLLFADMVIVRLEEKLLIYSEKTRTKDGNK